MEVWMEDDVPFFKQVIFRFQPLVLYTLQTLIYGRESFNLNSWQVQQMSNQMIYKSFLAKVEGYKIIYIYIYLYLPLIIRLEAIPTSLGKLVSIETYLKKNILESFGSRNCSDKNGYQQKRIGSRWLWPIFSRWVASANRNQIKKHWLVFA